MAKARHYHFLLQELLNLCATIPHTRSSYGRPVEFPLPTLFVLLGLKVDSGLVYCDFVASVDFNPSLLQRLQVDRAPRHTLLNSALRRLDTQLLHHMYRLITREHPPPRTVAVDATGFSHSTVGEWLTVRCQRTRRRQFHALHNAVDTDTLMVHATRVTARPGGDARHMIGLVRRVPLSGLEVVYGDKGYISRRNVQFIAGLGAYPAIEPKRGLGVNARGHRAYGELLREYRADPEAWKERHTYGKRSLVETVFSMLKVRFGGGLRSRGHMQQRRELLIKVVLHNIERLNYLQFTRR